MREFLNENTLFATIAMYVQESGSLLLVVEGDDDHLVLKTHVSTDLDLLPGTGGRGQVLRAANLAVRRGLKGVLFLVDRDYDDYTGSTATALENVLVSTHHDLFTDLEACDPELMNRVIDLHTAPARRRPGAQPPDIPEPMQIRDDAFGLAAHLAAVRVVDAEKGLNLDFKRFSFGSLREDEFNVRSIATTLLDRCRHVDTGGVDVMAEAVEARSRIPQDAVPVGDHDLFAALSRVLKNFNIFDTADSLQRTFIAAVSCFAISSTAWFHEIQAWSARNNRNGFTCEQRSVTA